ncbi:MAG: hypothetical protein BWK77_05810 [Verrucomicrobia bacterium A1]|nr:MAG: hypothetical protein BWK77_05810 [Verrucomicrobia bacterium A1]
MSGIEPATLTITGVIATVLSLVFAFASHATSRKRQRERVHLEAVLKAQREESPAFAAPPSAHPSPAVYAAPAAYAPQVVADATERPRVPAAYAPAAHPDRPAPPPRPAPAGPQVFKQYVTRPGTKAMTPVVESLPTDRDYVWE